ncbi:hypothetical protein [Arthrobacter sunyaminii]|uniref:Uncharacterized protein n=1 Tax=Arthrobacter sunyaminii TaxID=2816859 RepID=A0A975XKT8_9MICC|nr:hypothetical protein [Arthrobacter sunyaminii]MBO0909699.1 hypothetical protein [Arthrobacter sunyaminii]QWQ36502.1 hypothetical protein KG104_01340 [Arthrobacter sunyaminii]
MNPDRLSPAKTRAARADALAGRATYKWAAGCAAVSLAAFLLAAGILLTGALYWPGADLVRILASMFLGPLSLTLTAAALSYQSGRLSAPEALLTAAAAVPGWGLTAAAAISWSAGFTAADAGVPLNWFEAATLPILALALIAGTAALLPIVNTLWSPHRPLASRTTQSLLLAAPAALALVIAFMVGFLFAPFAAAGLLYVALRAESADPRPMEPTTRLPDSRSVRTAVVVIAGGTLLVGLLCIGFALSGSTWSNLAEDSTAAMNLGLAAGALNAVPLTVAVGLMLLPRFGSVIRWTALLVSGAFLCEAASQFAGAGHPWQWPLTLSGAVLLGFGIALPAGKLVPGSSLLRLGVTVGVGFAGTVVGVFIVAGAGFIAPLVSAGLLVWCFLPQVRQRPS